MKRLRSQHSTKGDSTIFKVSILLDFAFDNLFEVSRSMSLQLSLWEEALMVLFIHKLWDFAQVFVFLVFGWRVLVITMWKFIFFRENVILKLGRWLWLLIKLLVVLWLGFSSNYIWEFDYLLSVFILGFCHEIAYEVDVWCALRCLLPSFLFLWMGELNWLFDDEYSCC